MIKKMDLEDISFLRDLTEELKAHGGVYEGEVVELENIIYRELEPLFIGLGVEA